MIGSGQGIGREYTIGEFSINVNAIAAGLVLSEAGKLRNQERIDFLRSLPKDLLGTLIFPCSDESDLVAGKTIIVDGGQAFLTRM